MGPFMPTYPSEAVFEKQAIRRLGSAKLADGHMVLEIASER
jgi:hypothetical protein